MNNKELDMGFIILSPDSNYGLVKSTANIIQSNYKKSSVLCIVGENARPEDLVELNRIIPTYQSSGNNINLINLGMEKSKKEWNMIVTEGILVRRNLDVKYAYFLKNDKDILFPIVVSYDQQGKPINIQMNFISPNVNGLLLHKRAIQEVGKFSDNPTEVSKFFWAIDAVDRGFKFKSVLGTKVC